MDMLTRYGVNWFFDPEIFFIATLRACRLYWWIMSPESSARKSYLFILPVFNEATILERSVRTLVSFLTTEWKECPWKIVIADNGSIDGTVSLVAALQAQYPRTIAYHFVAQPGRGQALQSVLAAYPASYVMYLDTDLPLLLEEIPLFFRPLEEGRADVVVGKRIGARPWRRIMLTRCLRWVNAFLFDLKLSDAQCGVKAFTQHVLPTLMACRERGYFLDTEFVSLAQMQGKRIQEVPVHWIEQRYPERASKIHAIRDSFRGLAALGRITHRHYPRLRRDLLLFIGAGSFLLAVCLGTLLFVSRPDFTVAHQVSGSGGIERVVIFNLLFALSMWLTWAVLRTIQIMPWRLFAVVTVLFFCIIACVAIATHPTRSQDIYWNLLLAKGFVVDHFNPYHITPSLLRDDPWFTPLQAWTNLSMTHGPLWVLIVSAVVWLGRSLSVSLALIKCVTLAMLVGSGVVLWRIMALHTIDPPKRVSLLAFLAWNPFIIQTVLVDVHNDIFILFLILASYFFLKRRQYVPSALLLVVGGLIKYVSLLLLPIPLLLLLTYSWRRRSYSLVMFVLAASLCTVLLYAPFGGFSVHNLAGIQNEVGIRGAAAFSLVTSALVFFAFHLTVPHMRLFGLMLGVVLVFWFLYRRQLLRAYTMPYVAIFLLATPWFLPWYALWIFPLIALELSLLSLATVSTFLILVPEVGDPLGGSILLTIALFTFFLLRQARRWTAHIEHRCVSPGFTEQN